MSQHLQKEIKKDVRKWSEEFLEIPNKHLGGFPACPFAKKTWNNHKVVIETKRKFKQYKSELNTHLKQFKKQKQMKESAVAQLRKRSKDSIARPKAEKNILSNDPRMQRI